MTDQVPFPIPPKDRRTHGAFPSYSRAIRSANELVRLLNGVPFGYRLGIFDRFGAYLLVSYPTGTVIR